MSNVSLLKILLGVLAAAMAVSGNPAKADTRVAACFIKGSPMKIIKDGLLPTEGLATPVLLNKCKALAGSLVIWDRMGITGSRGLTGTTGGKGLPGDKGDPGTQGTPGARGDKGERGGQGKKGQTGDQGDPGPTGPPGPSLPDCLSPSRGDNLAGCDLTLPNVDFSIAGRDLRGINAAGAKLSGLILPGYSFVGASFIGAGLAGTRFFDFSRNNIALIYSVSDLRFSHFTAADLTGADFSGADLRFADFTGAKLDGAAFRTLNGVRQYDANLCGARFSLTANYSIEGNPAIGWAFNTICPNNQRANPRCEGSMLVPAEYCEAIPPSIPSEPVVR